MIAVHDAGPTAEAEERSNPCPGEYAVGETTDGDVMVEGVSFLRRAT